MARFISGNSRQESYQVGQEINSIQELGLLIRKFDSIEQKLIEIDCADNAEKMRTDFSFINMFESSIIDEYIKAIFKWIENYEKTNGNKKPDFPRLHPNYLNNDGSISFTSSNHTT